MNAGIKKPYPFSIFKRADRSCYSVSFKDKNGKYLRPVSTGKKNEAEAIQTAFVMLRDGVPQGKTSLTVQDLSLKDMVRRLNTETEADIVLSEMKRLGWVKSAVLKNTPQAVDFTSFLSSFWDWDTSPYINDKLRKKHGIHKMHCLKQGQAIKLYWEPFFKGRYLGEITANDIDDFITHMGKHSLSSSRKNVVVKAGTKPLRWAFSKGKIEIDPTRGHTMFSVENRERQILSPTAAATAFRVVWKDERAKVANMLASVTGMRSGEILALRLQDIGKDCIYVRASWNRADKIKSTKNNEPRTVEIPFPDLISELVHLAKQNPWGASPDSFVFWADTKKDIPMSGRFFIDGLRESLTKIGFSKEEASKYMFHGWRHFFTSYMINKLDKKLLKSQTGHKTDVMLAHYADHCIEGDRERIQATERETFAGLLPERPKMLIFKKEPNVEAVCG
jgi:integrase